MHFFDDAANEDEREDLLEEQEDEYDVLARAERLRQDARRQGESTGFESHDVREIAEAIEQRQRDRASGYLGDAAEPASGPEESTGRAPRSRNSGRRASGWCPYVRGTRRKS